MKQADFAVGIDLGTTHCAMAVSPISEPKLRLVSIPQLLAPGEVGERELLPSFMYLPAKAELPEAARQLPWGSCEYLVGEGARQRGAKTPTRLVASAKSWVCHGGVNRRAAILPWSAPESEAHVSPFDAQVAYLRHLHEVWMTKYPSLQLAQQDVVVTVPASFDEGARQLTTEAAAEAGLGEVRLLEEPQAAFYDFLGEQGQEEKTERQLQKQLQQARLILVVDVGGGTTDMTLLRVTPPQGDSERPTIDRIAVGGHLMLGGDNMDAALALYALEQAGMQRPEDAGNWSALVHSARVAKETLLSSDAPEQVVISYQGRGSRLMSQTKSLKIARVQAQEFLLDGFFPKTGRDETAQRSGRAGLTSLGLPYTNDTAVSKHICSFLRRHVAAAEEAGAEIHQGLPRPDLLLLNGGVFNAPAVVSRLQELLASWYDGSGPELLNHTSLESAVARGAVRSILARHGQGEKIGGGAARAYYVGLQAESGALALCVAPKNAMDGSRAIVRDRIFELRLNEPVSFPLYSYSGDQLHEVGHLWSLEESVAELDALPALETILRAKKAGAQREVSIAVSLESSLDEVGNLSIELVSVELPPRRWKLDFSLPQAASTKTMSANAASANVGHAKSETTQAESPKEAAQQSTTSQGPAAAASSSPTPVAAANNEPVHAQIAQALPLIQAAFVSADEERVKGLRLKLEDVLGVRGLWSGATCRRVFDACFRYREGRELSEAHELNWLRLCGWGFRPGFGFQGDAERLAQLWALREAGPVHPTKGNWAEWWIMWRRVAPGLDALQQAQLFEQLSPWLWPKGKMPPGPQAQGPVEMMRLLAALERLTAEQKSRCGRLFIERHKKLGSYWPLGRVGARVLFHGNAEQVVAITEAEKWLSHLLQLDWEKSEGAAFAAAAIAQRCGVADKEISQALREQVVARLTALNAPASWVDMVLRQTDWATGDLKRVLGDSLPSGLSLKSG